MSFALVAHLWSRTLTAKLPLCFNTQTPAVIQPKQPRFHHPTCLQLLLSRTETRLLYISVHLPLPFGNLYSQQFSQSSLGRDSITLFLILFKPCALLPGFIASYSMLANSTIKLFSPPSRYFHSYTWVLWYRKWVGNLGLGFTSCPLPQILEECLCCCSLGSLFVCLFWMTFISLPYMDMKWGVCGKVRGRKCNNAQHIVLLLGHSPPYLFQHSFFLDILTKWMFAAFLRKS